MTPERLAKVAEPDTALVRDTYAAMRARIPQHHTQSAREEFDRWLAGREAAAEALGAASEALLTISAQAVRAAYDDEERLSGHLIEAATRVKAVCNDLRALDAAEKAAVEGVAGAVSAEDAQSGHGDAGRGSEVCGVPSGDGYTCDLPKGHA